MTAAVLFYTNELLCNSGLVQASHNAKLRRENDIPPELHKSNSIYLHCICQVAEISDIQCLKT